MLYFSTRCSKRVHLIFKKMCSLHVHLYRNHYLINIDIVFIFNISLLTTFS